MSTINECVAQYKTFAKFQRNSLKQTIKKESVSKQTKILNDYDKLISENKNNQYLIFTLIFLSIALFIYPYLIISYLLIYLIYFCIYHTYNYIQYIIIIFFYKYYINFILQIEHLYNSFNILIYAS